MSLSLKEHLAIVDAVEQGNSEGAESAALEHIRSVQQTFLESLERPQAASETNSKVTPRGHTPLPNNPGETEP